MESYETPARAMLVIPHPDDGESGCGGTVSKWILEGCQILYVVCTNGDKGTSDPNMTSERLAQIREEEQTKAAAVLGVQELIFLRYGDGELEDTPYFRGQLVHEIRRFKPDVVLAMDPVHKTSHAHRDHRVSGQVALDACFPYSRDTLHYSEHLKAEGLDTHKVGMTLLWGTESPDIAINITDSLDPKFEALACHSSQVNFGDEGITTWKQRWSERISERSIETGHKYAELFRSISFRR
jgi:LmbE family N-acetylglucosaminyl deacetylase